jgi:hypothetical protein
MQYEKYLPLGTVVMLHNGTKRVMITGFCAVAEENKNKIYDYSGCLYPEGFISSSKTLLFDHNQIKTIYFLGYSDDEEKQFKMELKNIISNITGEK